MSRSRRYEAYEPPVSLWSLVEIHVPESERPEMKNLLGESLVDQSLELQDEVGTLLEIWRDVQVVESPRQLPEPPGVRDRLVQQILFYVDSIKEKVSKDGRDPDDVLCKCRVEVIDYACDSARGSTSSLSRPSTARSSRDGRDTPWRQHTPSSDRALSISSVELESAMNSKLNVLDYDEVSKQLTEYLQYEVQQLLDDIPFLQECIERSTNESDTDDDFVEPTLHDLREERSKLERELLTESPPTVPNMPTVSSKLTKFDSPIPPRGTAFPTPPPRSATTGGAQKRARGPVRASHSINVRVVDLPDHTNPPITASRDEQNNNLLVKQMTSQTGSTNQRPSSADRFRRMVIGCRPDT